MRLYVLWVRSRVRPWAGVAVALLLAAAWFIGSSTEALPVMLDRRALLAVLFPGPVVALIMTIAMSNLEDMEVSSGKAADRFTITTVSTAVGLAGGSLAWLMPAEPAWSDYTPLAAIRNVAVFLAVGLAVCALDWWVAAPFAVMAAYSAGTQFLGVLDHEAGFIRQGSYYTVRAVYNEAAADIA